MKLLVGLGNPGEKYVDTRHNLGFALVDEYVHKHNLGDWNFDKKFKAEIIQVSSQSSVVSSQLILARPQTYMNLSGDAVSAIASYFKIDSTDIIILQDDLDLMLGKIKVRLGGAAAGHHGVESVIEKLGTDQFIRLRMGIGNPKTRAAEHHHEHISVEDFVVSHFNEHETSDVKHLLKQSLHALELLLEKGLETAQQQYN